MTTRQIRIVLDGNSEGIVSCEGLGDFPCLGNAETMYPARVASGGEEGVEKFPELYSNELDANIDQAVLLGWEHGLFIHAGADTAEANGGPTSGNIQVAPGNAKRLYDWIDGPVEISISKN